MGCRQLENDGMSILGDFLLEALDASISLGPSSDWGIVARFSGSSFLLLVATVWLLTTSVDPIRQPGWGLGVLAGSVLCGAGGLLVSGLHLRRVPSDRLFALVCLTLNMAALALPMLWLFTR